MAGAANAFTALRALVYASGFVGLWAWLAYRAHLHDGRLSEAVPGWLRGPGVVLMALGTALAIWCMALFVAQGRGTPAPFDAPRVFVASGPYRRVRNPMYLGLFLALHGYALCAGSLVAVFVPFAMLALAHLFVVLYEEPTLERRFGSSYAEYKRRTPRWIPRPLP